MVFRLRICRYNGDFAQSAGLVRVLISWAGSGQHNACIETPLSALHAAPARSSSQYGPIADDVLGKARKSVRLTLSDTQFSTAIKGSSCLVLSRVILRLFL